MKFFLAIFLGVAVLYGQTSGRLLKINGAPVCFGARGNQFGHIVYRGPNTFASGFLLVHRSGWVSCRGRGKNVNDRTRWGCIKYAPTISVALTDCKNKVMAPRPKYKTVVHKAWYKMQGYTASSPFLVFPVTGGNPKVKKRTKIFIKNTHGFRLWYMEDLFGHTEGDNAGRSCADVYMII